MKNPRTSLSLMALLVIHEDLVGQLYDAFAKKFPEHEEFWSTLAEEEVHHANLVCTLELKALGKRKFNPNPVLNSLDYLRVLLANAQQDLSLRIALMWAVQIETYMLENKFFEVDKQDDAKVKRVLGTLAAETKAHAERLRELQSKIAHAGG